MGNGCDASVATGGIATHHGRQRASNFWTCNGRFAFLPSRIAAQACGCPARSMSPCARTQSIAPDPLMERQTARLRLRKPSLDDAATVLAIFGDPATSRFNPAGPMRDIGAARARLEAWIAHWDEYGFGYWAIHETDVPDTVIGFGGLLWRPLRGYTGRLQLGYRFATGALGSRPRHRVRAGRNRLRPSQGIRRRAGRRLAGQRRIDTRARKSRHAPDRRDRRHQRTAAEPRLQGGPRGCVTIGDAAAQRFHPACRSRTTGSTSLRRFATRTASKYAGFGGRFR